MLGIIFPVYATLVRPDTTTTLTDESLREPRRVDLLSFGDPDAAVGARGGEERAPIVVPVQNLGEDFERLNQMISGDSAISFFDLTFARRDAKKLGLIRPDGQPDIPKQTRLTEIRRKNGEIIVEIKYPLGLYVHEVIPRSFGLNPFGNSTANLWFLRVRARMGSTR